MAGPQPERDFFIYSYLVSLLASQVSTLNQTIEANSDFLLYGIAFDAGNGVAKTDSTRVIPPVTVLITDTGSGKNLMNIAVPLSILAGEGDSVFKLPTPRRFKANSSIQIQFANLDAGNAYGLTFSLIGEKVYSK